MENRTLARAWVCTATIALVAMGSPVDAQPAAKTGNPVGVFLRCTGQDDPLLALRAVKTLGLDTVQVSRLPDRFYTPEGAAEFAGMLRSTGIRADSVVAVFAGESYADRDTVVRTVGFRPLHLIKERLEYLRKCVDFADAIGAKIVTFHMGFLPENAGGRGVQGHAGGRDRHRGVRREEARRHLARDRAGNRRAACRVPRQDHRGPRRGQLRSRPTSSSTASTRPRGRLKHFVARVTSVHVKDALLPETPGAMGREVRPGEGRAELSECFRMLRASGFTGALIIENYVARGLKTDPMDELRFAQAFLRKSGW